MLETVLEELKTVAAIVVIVAPWLGAGAYLFRRLAKLEATDEAQEFKIRIVWEWIMRHSIIEGLSKGIITKNSPVAATDSVRPYFESVKDKMHDFYRTKGRYLKEYELEMYLADLIGIDFLEDLVCKPLSLDRGSCLKAAAAIAKEARLSNAVIAADSWKRSEDDTAVRPRDATG